MKTFQAINPTIRIKNSYINPMIIFIKQLIIVQHVCESPNTFNPLINFYNSIKYLH